MLTPCCCLPPPPCCPSAPASLPPSATLRQAGLYSEVTDENGKVAVLSDEASIESYKKHGKTVCHRCAGLHRMRRS